MEYWTKQVDNATDIDEITEIIEDRAAFDETISNKAYFDIVEYALNKIKNWRNK